MSKSDVNRVVAPNLTKIIGIGALLGLVGAIAGLMFGIPSEVAVLAASGTAGVVIGAVLVKRNNSSHQ